MARKPKAFFDQRAGCWATNALGELRTTRTGRTYRARTYNRELTHDKRDRLAAQAWLHAELARIARDRVPAGQVTFEALAQYYLQDAEGSLKPETYANRVAMLRVLVSWPAPDHPRRLGARAAGRVTAADVRAMLAEMVAKGNSESYVVQGLLKALKRAYSWAVEVEPGRFPGLPLDSNPVARLKGPSVPRRAHREVDPAVVRALLRWLWRRALKMTGLKRRFTQVSTILLLCLRDTGARPKEMCVAEWSEWTLLPDGWGIITLPPQKWKNGPKTGKVRVIAVPPHCAKRIEWIRSQPGHHPTHIFVHRRAPGTAAAGAGSPWAGEPWCPTANHDTRSLRRWFYRRCQEARKAGVPLPPGFRMYWLRSGYSTEAQRRGVPGAMLAESMGTSERMLEAHYSDFAQKDILNVAREVRRRGKD